MSQSRNEVKDEGEEDVVGEEHHRVCEQIRGEVMERAVQSTTPLSDEHGPLLEESWDHLLIVHNKKHCGEKQS